MRRFDDWYNGKDKKRKFPHVYSGASIGHCCGASWLQTPYQSFEGIAVSPDSVNVRVFDDQREQVDVVSTKNGVFNIHVRTQW